MRILLCFLCLFFLQVEVKAESPRVPESIEIAEIKLRFTAEVRAEIQKEVDALRASEKFFQIKLDRINLYFPLIEKALKEEGVPDDLKYLSVQESSLISDAVSSSDAVGFWQFKDFTAREVGLRVDSKVDERKNIVSASHGAAKYFKRNNFYFRNWIYSVSAYQAGPGGAKRYVDEKNFGSDKLTIDANTHWYVKRFIAHVIAFKDEVGGPHSEGLRLIAYDKGANKELKEIARDFKVEEDLVFEYNKWLKTSQVPADKTYAVIIPISGKVRVSEENESTPVSRTISEPKDHQTKHNETPKLRIVPILLNGRQALIAGAADDVASLAEKAQLLPRQLLKYNDLGADGEIQPGVTYYIQMKRNKADVAYHTVQRNETLWSISQKYGVKLKSLIKMNRLKEPYAIKVGQELWMTKKRPKAIPVDYKEVAQPPVKAPTQPVTYEPIVTSREVNPKPQEDTVKVKQVEVTAPQNQEEPVKEEEPIKEVELPKVEAPVVDKPTVDKPALKVGELYKVKVGETLWSISRSFGLTVQELADLNGIDKGAALKPGQELKVQKETYQTYKVTPGDTLYSIARKFGMTVAELKEMNSRIDNSLSIGEELKVKRY